MHPAASDPSLTALFVPFERGAVALTADARVLVLRARDGAALRARATAGWQCVQSFKPYADALNRAGLAVSAAPAGTGFDAVLLLPPRQRDEARALFADGLARLRAGGLLLASVGNDEGARSAQADLARLAGPLQAESKHHCRVFWTEAARTDAALLARWQALDAVQPIAGGWVSRPGLFAWNRIDPGSALLARHLPATLGGRVADFGGGWGYLSCELLARCAAVRTLDLFEAEARALAPAQANLERSNAGRAQSAALALHWHDVGAGVPGRFDVVVSNPPFHERRADQPELGQRFIAAAAAALADDGSLWLVANRHLPYEATLMQQFRVVDTVAAADGYKVFAAQGPRR